MYFGFESLIRTVPHVVRLLKVWVSEQRHTSYLLFFQEKLLLAEYCSLVRAINSFSELLREVKAKQNSKVETAWPLF